MTGNFLVLSLGMALAFVVRRTNYSIPGAISDVFMMGRYQKLVGILAGIGVFALVNIWGYEPCPTWADVGWGGAPGLHSLLGGILQGIGYVLIAGWPLATLVRLGGGVKRYMVAAGGFLFGVILFAQLAQPIHRVFDPLQVEGLFSIKQLFYERHVEGIPVKAPDLAVTTIDGRQIFLKELSNQNELVVINFWATWCVPCIEEMPDFEKVYRAYRHKKVAFLGVAAQDLTPAVREFISRLDITYEIAVDPHNKIASAFGGVKALPTTIFLDSKNSIVKTHKGYMAKKELEGNLDNLLIQ